MPFQDPQDLQNQFPRQPSAAEHWLRKILFEDWSLKLLAFAITFFLWFAVTGQKKPVTKRFSGVQLSFTHPEEMEISNEPIGKVDVTLTGTNDELERVNPMTLIATVAINDKATGDRVLRLSRDRVQLNLPEGVQVEGFQPVAVSVRLEPRIERQVDVEVKFEDKAADGYEVSGVSTNPAKVLLRGPASHVNKIGKAPTESISLKDRRDSFDLPQVSINIPDQKIDLREPVVQVHIEIREKAVTSNKGEAPSTKPLK